jgi:hypothetical protein
MVLCSSHSPAVPNRAGRVERSKEHGLGVYRITGDCETFADPGSESAGERCRDRCRPSRGIRKQHDHPVAHWIKGIGGTCLRLMARVILLP